MTKLLAEGFSGASYGEPRCLCGSYVHAGEEGKKLRFAVSDPVRVLGVGGTIA